MPDERLYFAYGSNLHPMRLTERVGEIVVVSTASLPSYELRFDKVGGDGSGKCNMVRADSASGVVGVVYRLTVEQLAKLDEFESMGAGYQHVVVEVVSSSARMSAVSYEAMPEYRDGSLLPHDWYRDLVVEGAWFHRFPEAYVERLRKQRVIGDPDEERAQTNEILLARMREARDRSVSTTGESPNVAKRRADSRQGREPLECQAACVNEPRQGA